MTTAAQSGVFELNSAEDLFAKLEHDFGRVQRNPTDAYAAYDFFVTAHHLADWKYWNDGQAKAECRNSTLMRICSSLANSGKHFRMGRESVVNRTSQHQGAFDLDVFDPAIFDTDTLLVHLEATVAAAYGHQEVGVLTLASDLIQFWEQRLKE